MRRMSVGKVEPRSVYLVGMRICHVNENEMKRTDGNVLFAFFFKDERANGGTIKDFMRFRPLILPYDPRIYLIPPKNEGSFQHRCPSCHRSSR